jgi:molybdopterin-guanine dinucleotide biosynthesis protein A
VNVSSGPVPPLLGAVLTGGQSTRFGRPKWSEPLGGIPMALRAVAALAPHAREVVLVSPASDHPTLDLPVVTDAEGAGGPVAGLVAALARAESRGHGGSLVLACDLPLVDPGLVGTLVGAWAGEDVVAPERRGRLQPLCALWSVAALPAARAALASEDRSVVGLVARLRLRALVESEWRTPSTGPDPLFNVNTLADLDRAAALLAHRGAFGDQPV